MSVGGTSLESMDAGTARLAGALLQSAFLQGRSSLWRFLRFKTGDDCTADDLLQDMWFRVERAQAGQLRDPEAFLKVIARNLVTDWRRHQKLIARHSAPLELALDAACEQPSAFDQLASRQAFALLVSIIEELPPKRRKAFLLHRFGGLKMVEVAKRMGITAGTVERQVAMALSHCQARLMEMGWRP